VTVCAFMKNARVYVHYLATANSALHSVGLDGTDVENIKRARVEVANGRMKNRRRNGGLWLFAWEEGMMEQRRRVLLVGTAVVHCLGGECY